MGCFSSKILKELATFVINFNLYIPWFPCQGVEKWIPLLHSNRHWLESARFWLVSSQVDRLCTPISARKKVLTLYASVSISGAAFPLVILRHETSMVTKTNHETRENMVLRKRKPFSSAQVQAKCHELVPTKTMKRDKIMWLFLPHWESTDDFLLLCSNLLDSPQQNISQDTALHFRFYLHWYACRQCSSLELHEWVLLPFCFASDCSGFLTTWGGDVCEIKYVSPLEVAQVKTRLKAVKPSNGADHLIFKTSR